MKMVKTFMKTQHHKRCLQRKGKQKKTYKANPLAWSLAKAMGEPGLPHSFRTYWRTR